MDLFYLQPKPMTGAYPVDSVGGSINGVHDGSLAGEQAESLFFSSHYEYRTRGIDNE